MEDWPKGQVATSAWLKSIGISSQLTQRYLQSGWIETMGVGAYKKPKEAIYWPGGLATLQSQLLLNIHLGGPTAFSVRGGAHYVRFGKEQIFLFSPLKERLPKWFIDFSWENPIRHIKTSILPRELGISIFKHENLEIKVSSPERAILECLHVSPKEFDLLECYQILESQLTLRPDLMQQLLVSCHSVRVKRLFLYMAKKANLPVIRYIDCKKIDLGSGDRSIVKNGIYDATYKISIPKELVNYV